MIVDGHNSHYTRAFLEYAHTHRIVVLCYPSHTTHVLQGLDVVIFAVLKRCLGEERDRWERETGEKISKQNFLAIYGRAHLCVMSSDNIHAAFRATGVWPFNPGVVTEEMMAPSKETSCEGSLPIVPATPIWIVAKLLRGLLVLNDLPATSTPDSDDSEGVESEEGGDEPDHTHEHAHGDNKELCHVFEKLSLDQQSHMISDARQTLLNGPLAELVSDKPLPATFLGLNHHTLYPISPPRNMSTDISTIAPQTQKEAYLLTALQESRAHEIALKQRLLHLQAANILNEAYCSKLRGQLAHYEGKKEDTGGKGRLMGDGLPCLLLGEEFYQKVLDHEAWIKREKQAKNARQRMKVNRTQALAEWRRLEDERKAENAARREEWEAEKQAWEVQKADAKVKKIKFTVKRPVLGKLRGPIQKPRAVKRTIDESSDEEESEREGGSDTD